MPSVFSGLGILVVLGSAVFYLCLALLAVIGSVVLGHPGYTRSFTLIFIGQTYIVFIQYMTDDHYHHIGIQIQTTNMLHTMAYQVIPIVLNYNIFDPNELPPDYQVSHHDLYIGDILFEPHPPAIGQPTADEDEVLRTPPPYPEQYPRVEDNRANPSRGQPNRHQVIRPALFGLPNGPRGRRYGRISDAEVNSVLSQALHPKIILGDISDEPIGSGPS